MIVLFIYILGSSLSEKNHAILRSNLNNRLGKLSKLKQTEKKSRSNADLSARIPIQWKKHFFPTPHWQRYYYYCIYRSP